MDDMTNDQVMGDDQTVAPMPEEETTEGEAPVAPEMPAEGEETGEEEVA
jgi:hypothetical protein